MEESEGYGISFERGVDGQFAAFDAGVWDSTVPECGQGGDARGIDEVAGVREDVDVCSERPNLGGRCKWIFLGEGVVSSIERAGEE